MNMSLHSGLVQSLAQKTSLTTEQKITFRQILHEVSLDLRERFFGPIVAIRVVFKFDSPLCPECSHTLLPLSPTDKSGTCSFCGFPLGLDEMTEITRLYIRERRASGGIYLARYTETRIIAELSRVSPFQTPLSLFQADQTLYVNAMHNYGSLVGAFAAAGIQYMNPALEHWQAHIVDFLGILPDTEIAEVTGRTHQAMRYYREWLGIGTYRELMRSIDDDFTPEMVQTIQAENREKLRAFSEERKDKIFPDVRKQARQIVAQHLEKPDREIVGILAAQGIKVARRTVNKYRKEIAEDESASKPR